MTITAADAFENVTTPATAGRQTVPVTLDAEAEATYAYDQIGAFIVFYDVQEEGRRVCVRAIRRKPAHRSTEEIL